MPRLDLRPARRPLSLLFCGLFELLQEDGLADSAQPGQPDVRREVRGTPEDGLEATHLLNPAGEKDRTDGCAWAVGILIHPGERDLTAISLESSILTGGLLAAEGRAI